jgi:hypothetical protein
LPDWEEGESYLSHKLVDERLLEPSHLVGMTYQIKKRLEMFYGENIGVEIAFESTLIAKQR